MIHTLQDINGTGVSVAISGIPFSAVGLQINQINNISGLTARVGDSSVSASRGIPVYPQEGRFLGPSYGLTGLFVWLGAGDVVSLAWFD